MAVMHYAELLPSLPPETVAAALMEALRFHEPERTAGFPASLLCRCRDKGGARPAWPCPEVRAIIAALGGES